MNTIKIEIFNDKSYIRFYQYENLREENEKLKQQNKKLKQKIKKAKITLNILENTEDNFEGVFCLEKLKELLGDTNDKR